VSSVADDIRQTSALRTTTTSSLALTTAVLPVFLIGALSDAIRRDLGFGEAAIGAAVTVMFVSASLTAAPAGWLSERLGSGTAQRSGALVSGLATAAIGLFAHSWWQLTLPLIIVGAAVGLIDTGAARAFSERVPASRQGSAFGIKEASVPGASLLAGLALPTIAVQVGWRGTFVAALAIAAAVLVALPRTRGRARGQAPGAAPVVEVGGPAQAAGGEPATSRAGRIASAGMVRLAAAAGLGTGAATAAATFLVPAITARGVGAATAGLILSVASVASITVRLAAGRWADDATRVPTRAVGALLLVGAVGAGLLAALGGAVVTTVSAVLVLGGGWGWTGLAFLSAVRARPDAPAAAAGVVLTGLGAGGALGPLAFGAIAGRGSYPAAWTAAALALAVAAVAAFTVRPGLASAPGR
jgi:predicted MFS family arabinose efflux permease